jgi:hypothetical protein
MSLIFGAQGAPSQDIVEFLVEMRVAPASAFIAVAEEIVIIANDHHEFSRRRQVRFAAYRRNIFQFLGHFEIHRQFRRGPKPVFMLFFPCGSSILSANDEENV